MEVTLQQVNSDISVWLKWLRVNIIWKILHSRWTLVLQFQWISLQWLLFGKYFTSVEHWYCSLNEVPYSEYYMVDTSQQVDTDIAVWMNYLTVSIIWKILQCRWTLNDVVYSEYYIEDTSQQVNTVFQFEWSALHWILYGKYFTALNFEWSALQWVLYGRYFTAGVLWMKCLTLYIIWKIFQLGTFNELPYSEYYMEDTARQVNTVIAASKNFLTVNITWICLDYK
jgi:hypothetical protein